MGRAVDQSSPTTWEKGLALWVTGLFAFPSLMWFPGGPLLTPSWFAPLEQLVACAALCQSRP